MRRPDKLKPDYSAPAGRSDFAAGLIRPPMSGVLSDHWQFWSN